MIMDTSNEHMHIEQEREETVAAVVKNRAHRRAHGQRGTAYLPVAKHRSRGQRAETGPQRAQRRAAARGLIVGQPVRVVHPGGNLLAHYGLQQAHMVPKRIHQFGGEPVVVFPRAQRPQMLEPLEFGERLSNYRLQQAVRTHHVGGTKWRPTARQRRRLDHKANHAQAPFGRKHPDYGQHRAEAMRGRRADLVIVDDDLTPLTVPTPRTPMIEQRSGFRVVDRRGEHG